MAEERGWKRMSFAGGVLLFTLAGNACGTEDVRPLAERARVVPRADAPPIDPLPPPPGGTDRSCTENGARKCDEPGSPPLTCTDGEWQPGETCRCTPDLQVDCTPECSSTDPWKCVEPNARAYECRDGRWQELQCGWDGSSGCCDCDAELNMECYDIGYVGVRTARRARAAPAPLRRI